MERLGNTIVKLNTAPTWKDYSKVIEEDWENLLFYAAGVGHSALYLSISAWQKIKFLI
jgi:hypothetical protein